MTEITKREVLRGEVVGWGDRPSLKPSDRRHLDRLKSQAVVAIQEHDLSTAIAIHKEGNRAAWIEARADVVDMVAGVVIEHLADRSQKIGYYFDKVDPATVAMMMDAHREAFMAGKALIREAGQ